MKNRITLTGSQRHEEKHVSIMTFPAYVRKITMFLLCTLNLFFEPMTTVADTAGKSPETLHPQQSIQYCNANNADTCPRQPDSPPD